MHGWRFPQHEDARWPSWPASIGFTQVSVSHQVSPLMKIVGRGDTTVVDAYLSPILRAYVDRVAAATGAVRLMFMQSNGGLVDAHRFQGKDAILSGPAGGVVGAVATLALAGCDRIVGFDMGGTSTDVTHYAGELRAGLRYRGGGRAGPGADHEIHTVAAGGGSIIAFDGQRFRVGPESAGANPGPGLLPPRRAAGRDRRQPDWSARSCRICSRRSSARRPISRSIGDVVRGDFAALAAEVERGHRHQGARRRRSRMAA